MFATLGEPRFGVHDILVQGEQAFTYPYGLMSPAQMFAMKVTRFMATHGISDSALRAISLACYHHAQNNPNAVGRQRTAQPSPTRVMSQTCWLQPQRIDAQRPPC